FPPTTILLSLCMLDWGLTEEVKARLGYYLSHYVKPDGTFDYYGPAISEYGQMLALAARYVQVTGDTNWFQENLPALRRITDSLVAQVWPAANAIHLARPITACFMVRPKRTPVKTRGSIFRAMYGAGAGLKR